MKSKTSITLSQDVLAQIDRLAGSTSSRSAVIEQVLRDYLTRRARRARDSRELQRLNLAAERLNAEAADVLAYQAWPDDDQGPT